MAIVQTGRVVSSASGSTFTLTHGLTINEDDLCVAFINRDASGTPINLGSGGSTWIEDSQQNGTQSTRYALHYKLAGASEPDDYTWALNTSQNCTVSLRVFSGVDTTTPLDVASVSGGGGSSVSHVATGITVAAGSVAIAYVQMDDATRTYTGVDNSYTDLLQAQNKTQGSAYLVQTGATGDVIFTASSARSFGSRHIAFAEAAGGGPTGSPWNTYAQQ